MYETREANSMTQGNSGNRDDRPRPRRRRRRHSEQRSAQARPPVPPLPPVPPSPPMHAEAPSPHAPEIDESLLTPEEREYLEVKRLAEEKLEFYREALKLALIVVPLLIFLPIVGVIVLIVGGMKLLKKLHRTLIEPGLRARLIRDEVSKRVNLQVDTERESLEGRHARSLEELSASIAHEIRNPITAAKSLVQQMGEDPTARDNVEYANVALGELERVERSISHLLRFARDEDVRSTEVRMAEILDSALETFRERAARSQVELIRQFDSEGRMYGDAEKLRRVAINLVGNAIDSLEESQVEKATVEVAMGENLAGTEVWIRVRDNGPGIEGPDPERLFTPFFTSKTGGTGLGLAITKKLVDAHGGSIEVISEPGRGAEFVLTFPKSPSRNGQEESR